MEQKNKFNKQTLMVKYQKQLAEIEERKEELSRIPDDKFDEDSVEEELNELREKEEEIENKIEEVMEVGRVRTDSMFKM